MLFLRKADVQDIEIVKSWFADANQLFYWGGPGLKLDSTLQAFCQQIKLHELPSYVLTDGDAVFGFGQYYMRLGRHHLARLAIGPESRGLGYGGTLVSELCKQARVSGSALNETEKQEFSLFVLADNMPALSMYRRLGFQEAVYPEPMPGGLEDCIYMVFREKV